MTHPSHLRSADNPQPRIPHTIMSRGSVSNNKRQGKMFIVYVTIFILVLGWSLTYLNLQLRLVATLANNNNDNHDDLIVVKNNKKPTSQRISRLQNNQIPLWKPTEHVNPNVALTGSFRYRETTHCTDNCNIYFPAVDLKTVLERDEAMDLLHERTTSSDDLNNNIISTSSVTSNLQSVATHALLTRGGNKDFGGMMNAVKANQDRALLLLSPFSAKAMRQNDFCLGLFDGHGVDGHVVSHHAAVELPKVLSRHLEQQQQSKPADALTQTFLELERTIPDAPGSGSTAIVMLRFDNTLYVANTGDSLAFVASCNADGSNARIVYQTKPHKPHLPKERARIERAGGIVMEATSSGDSSRVVIDVGNGMQLALAMSRSIGDMEGTPIGVIAEPTVDTLELQKLAPPFKKLFAVAASDGLLDRVPPEEVATELAKSLFGSNHGKSTLEVCEELIMKSSKLWIANGTPYRDDITVATIALVRE